MPATSSTLHPASRETPSSAGRRADRSRISLLAAAAVFAALTAIFFHPVLLGDKTLSAIAGHQSIQWPWAANPTGFPDSVQSDQANNVYPIQSDVNRALRKGDFPYWSPYSFGGGPTLGTVYGVGLYPPRLALSLTLSPVQVHDLFLLVHVWLAGMAMFLLLRRLGVSWTAGVLAGIAWMFCPGWFGLAILEGPAVVAALLPLSLWAMHRAIVRQSIADAVLCGVVLALFLLGGSVQPAVFCFTIVCLWGVLTGVRRGAPRSVMVAGLRNARLVAVSGGLGLLLSAFILIPGTAQISESGRSPVPYPVFEAADVGLDDLDNVADSAVPEPLTGEGVWALTFIGFPIALLALVGLFARRPGAGLGRTLVIVFALLVVGTPLTRLAYETVPGFAYLSPLGRLLPFLMFGVIILGALGLDVLRQAVERRVAEPRRHRVVIAMTAVALLLAGVEAWQVMRFSADVNPDFQPRAASDLFPRTPLIEALRQSRLEYERAGDAQRIVPVRNGEEGGPFSPPPLVGEVHRLFTTENIGGYMNVMPSRSRVVARLLTGESEKQALSRPVGAYMPFFYAAHTRYDLLERFGVGEIVAAPQTANPDPKLREAAARLQAQKRYSGSDGTLLRLPNAAKRAFVVEGVEVAPDAAGALARFTAPSFPFISTVVLDGPGTHDIAPRRQTRAPDASVRVLPGRNDKRTIEVESPRPGWLVLMESWDKGWSARVSGKKVPIHRANFAYRAVPIPSGRSIVEMKYSTPGLGLGIAVSVFGLAAAVALLVWSLRAARRVSARA